MAGSNQAGIESVPRGQFEAAQAQGFGYIQRMYYIIFPRVSKLFCHLWSIRL